MAEHGSTLNFPGRYEHSNIHANNTYNASNIYFASRGAQDALTPKQIESWLNGPNQHALQQNYLHQRQSGTGQWFLESNEFQSFCDPSTAATVLCCHGIRGSGKTILMSSAIEHLQAIVPSQDRFPNGMLLFLYLKSANREQHQHKQLMASLLAQVLQQQQQLSSTMRDFYLLHQRKGTYPGEKELVVLFYNELREIGTLYVVIDALDEATEQTRVALIKTLFGANANLHLLVTSYDVDTLGVKFEDNLGLGIQEQYMEITAREDDLRLYIKEQLRDTPSIEQLLTGYHKLHDTIVRILIEKARGMFLLAYLHLELLKSSRSCNTRRKLEVMAQNLSPTLNKVYEELWAEVLRQDPADSAMAQNVCVWLAFSTTPLHINVVRHALLFSEAADAEVAISEDDLIPALFLVGCCKGLVRVESVTQTVLFNHYTAHDFFPAYFGRLAGLQPHRDIALACLQQFKQTPRIEEEDDDGNVLNGTILRMLSDLPLLNYAIHSFDYHAKRTPHEQLDDHIMRLFDEPAQADTVALLCAWASKYSQVSQGHHRTMRWITVLHLLAFWGLEDSFLAMVRSGMSVDVLDEFHWSPLRWALWSGEVDMVKFLVRNGADLGAEPRSNANVMRWALGETLRPDSRLGSMTVTDGGTLDVGRTIFLSPISSSLWTRGPPLNTSEECLTALIEVASDDFLFNYGTDIFLVASRKRVSGVVLKMIDRNFLSQEAIDQGLIEALTGPTYCESTRSLLACDRAKVNIGWQVFIDAAEWSGINVDVHLISDDNRWICALISPENANLWNSKGQTVLSLAAEMSMLEVVQTLVQKGADVNVADADGRRPLHSAVMRTRTQKLFVHSCLATDRARVQLGASVYVYGSSQSSSASQIDAQEGINNEIVKLLLEKGADPYQTYRGITVPQLAEQEGYLHMRSLQPFHMDHEEHNTLAVTSALSHFGISVSNILATDRASAVLGRIYRSHSSDRDPIETGQAYWDCIASGALRAILSLLWIEVENLTLTDNAGVSVAVVFQRLTSADEIRNLTSRRRNVFDADFDQIHEILRVRPSRNDDSDGGSDEFYDARENLDAG